MSHLHIPDGLLPLPIVAAGLAITAVLLLVASRRLARLEGARVAPRIAVLSALMLVAMGLPFAGAWIPRELNSAHRDNCRARRGVRGGLHSKPDSLPYSTRGNHCPGP